MFVVKILSYGERNEFSREFFDHFTVHHTRIILFVIELFHWKFKNEIEFYPKYYGTNISRGNKKNTNYTRQIVMCAYILVVVAMVICMCVCVCYRWTWIQSLWTRSWRSWTVHQFVRSALGHKRQECQRIWSTEGVLQGRQIRMNTRRDMRLETFVYTRKI